MRGEYVSVSTVDNMISRFALQREHAGMKVRLDTAEADLRRFREALNEQHREKDAPVQAPEVRLAGSCHA